MSKYISHFNSSVFEYGRVADMATTLCIQNSTMGVTQLDRVRVYSRFYTTAHDT